MTRCAVDAKDLAARAVHVMGSQDQAAFEDLIHPEATNREAINEPPDCRGAGPAAFLATARWLQTAFSDLSWEIDDIVEDGDLVVVHSTMKGRHTGPFVGYGPDARPKVVMPPTGRIFRTTQSHWFRIADQKVIEHWANRDDRGTGEQLGWTPPSPIYLLRMLLATRKARAAAG
jgi:predicted ester cyclase